MCSQHAPPSSTRLRSRDAPSTLCLAGAQMHSAVLHRHIHIQTHADAHLSGRFVMCGGGILQLHHQGQRVLARTVESVWSVPQSSFTSFIGARRIKAGSCLLTLYDKPADVNSVHSVACGLASCCNRVTLWRVVWLWTNHHRLGHHSNDNRDAT